MTDSTDRASLHFLGQTDGFEAKCCLGTEFSCASNWELGKPKSGSVRLLFWVEVHGGSSGSSPVFSLSPVSQLPLLNSFIFKMPIDNLKLTTCRIVQTAHYHTRAGITSLLPEILSATARACSLDPELPTRSDLNSSDQSFSLIQHIFHSPPEASLWRVSVEGSKANLEAVAAMHAQTNRIEFHYKIDVLVTRALYLCSNPIPKFIHFTSNEILLRAFEGKDRVHIIDFDIKQGLQWPSLFQSLASRTNPPSHVRITGVGESKQELNETGDRLAGFAEALNLPFEFHPVVDRLEDVRLWMLHVKDKESVAVNCIFQLHKTLYDGSGGALRDFLGLIRSTNPSIVLMAEQEAEHNELSLETRVSNSLRYYSAIFDSIDYSLPLDSPVRMKVEEMFAREIRNIIACEGSDRVERHESFEKWRRRMEQGGFRCVGISEREMLQSQMLLKMYSCENYSVSKRGQDAALTLSWLDQPLYTVSAWTQVDVAGSSSSFSLPS
ncbi:Scarecrow-like protein 28 [Vitis vinifera]|uniref:Scarecrow-like protein 28 n=1 Tax=Vitis vinifera TaxID=29760 RepID=A0A438BZH4_VITVI|nr:Scarecrow-like protein 28 [Vitis vinifera]